MNGIPSCFVRDSCGARFAQFSVNNQYSPNYQIDSQVTNGTNLTLATANAGAVVYTASNVLVETRAAMDIPDYDYESADKLTSYTQMPFEFLGGGVVADASGAASDITGHIQPPAVMLLDEVTGHASARNVQNWWVPYVYKSGLECFLEDKYLLATSFDLDVSDKDRLVSGINTLGSNAQMFLNVIGGAKGDGAVAPNGPNVSTVFVLCTSMIQIYQGATLQIIQ